MKHHGSDLRKKKVSEVIAAICIGGTFAIGASTAHALPASLDSVTPNSGPALSETVVTASGQNFDSTTRLHIEPGGVAQVGLIDVFDSGMFDGGAVDSAVAGDYLAVVDWVKGLKIINKSVPTEMSLVAEESALSATGATSVAVLGDYIFVNNGPGIQIFSLSQSIVSGTAELVGSYAMSSVSDLETDGTYLYAYGSSFQVFSINVVETPVLTVTLQSEGAYAASGNHMVVSGNLAFISAGSETSALDISNPASPQYVGGYSRAGYMALEGNRLYISGYQGLPPESVDIVDISVPSSMYKVDEFFLWSDGGFDVQGMNIKDGILYVSYWKGGAGNHGFLTFDVSNDTQVVMQQYIVTAGDPEGITFDGNMAYVSDPQNGLIAYDISTNSPPQPVTICTTCTGGLLEENGTNLFSVNSQGLEVLDLSDPANVQIISTTSGVGPSNDVFVSGNYLYSADGVSGLRIVDISNVNSPSVVATHASSGEALAVTVAGNYAYLADGGGGLQIIDVTNPQSTQTVFSTSFPGQGVVATAIDGNYLYVAAGDVSQSAPVVKYQGLTQIHIYDITNPAQPQLLGTAGMEYTFAVTDILAANGALYVMSAGAVEYHDVTMPSSPAYIDALIWGWDEDQNPKLLLADGYLYAGPVQADIGGGSPFSGYGVNTVIKKVDINVPLNPVFVTEVSTLDLDGGMAIVGNQLATGSSDDVQLNLNAVLSNQSVVGNQIDATVPAGLAEGAYHLRVSNNEGVASDGVLHNSFHVGASAPPTEADLVVSSAYTTLSSFYRGTSVDFSANIDNQGGTTANNVSVDLYLSTDTTIDASDYFLGSATIAQLAAGGGDSVTVSANIDQPTDSYYIGAVVDAANTVVEADDSNNAAAGDFVAVATSASSELYVSSFNSPAQIGLNGSASINLTMTNLGGSTASYNYWGVYFSTDPDITTQDTRLMYGVETTMLAGASVTKNIFNLSLPPEAVLGGTYYLGVITDFTNRSAESDEGNNTAAAPFTVVANDVDAALTNVRRNYSSRYQGQSLKMTADIKNLGTNALSNLTVDYYLSTDSEITAGDIYMGSTTVASLAANGTASPYIYAPLHMDVGTYYLGAIVDSADAIAESNEDNNVLVGQTVSVMPGPDLVTQNLVAPSQAQESSDITVSYTMANIGGRNADRRLIYWDIYLSTDAVIDASDTLLFSHYNFGMDAGATSNRSVTVTLPAGATAGSYYIGVMADDTEVISEASETNNAAFSPITITAP